MTTNISLAGLSGMDFSFIAKMASRQCVGARGRKCSTRFVPAQESHVQCHACYKQDRERAKGDRLMVCREWARSLFEAGTMPKGVRVEVAGSEVRVQYAGTFVYFTSAKLAQQRAATQKARASIEQPMREREEFRKVCTEFARAAFEAGALRDHLDVGVTCLDAQVSVAHAGVSVTFISEQLKSQLAEAQRERRAAAAKAKAEAEAAAAASNAKGGKNKGGGKAARKSQAHAAA